jgi:hypothetical protein
MASLAQKTSISRLAADSIAEGCMALSAERSARLLAGAPIAPRALTHANAREHTKKGRADRPRSPVI